MMEKLHSKNGNASASNVGDEGDDDDDDFEIVNDDLSGDRDDIFKQLEKDLRNQIKIANSNSQYFTNLGDVPNATK